MILDNKKASVSPVSMPESNKKLIYLDSTSIAAKDILHLKDKMYLLTIAINKRKLSLSLSTKTTKTKLKFNSSWQWLLHVA